MEKEPNRNWRKATTIDNWQKNLGILIFAKKLSQNI